MKMDLRYNLEDMNKLEGDLLLHKVHFVHKFQGMDQYIYFLSMFYL